MLMPASTWQTLAIVISYTLNALAHGHARPGSQAAQLLKKIETNLLTKFMIPYGNKPQGSQYNLKESVAPGFHVYQARVKVKNELYANSMDVAIFAKNPSMARQLLIAQYGRDAVITNVVKIA